MVVLARQDRTARACPEPVPFLVNSCRYFRLLAARTTLAVVLVLALVQIIAHMHFFLRINLRHSARSELQLILFSTGIILLMVAGTLVILGNLRMRMM
jgi:cytochrome o ubiquinol oxidase subunit IV